ncbi:AraC family transcriptional regulator [Paenibacillus woosongensis]|uniref:AraC family transcriptional regulator n=1 Tax=Paenibacillus woosongensis TaxID=307580 RepID=A0ABQ4MQU5_9BACL|nr:helix-turn-helix domain-containing protein [Paenibacillus woosongensis]GIP58357.1 AraC family transcriptional regulator [Paenibacillus woosongensis]
MRQASIPSRPSMGVLNLPEGEKKFQLTRHAPAEALRFFVKHYWIVEWDLSGQPSYQQDVLPNPCVNLVVEQQKTAIFGISTVKYSHLLEGKGTVFGVKFKPGGFYPFMKSPVSKLTGQGTSTLDILGVAPQQLEDSLLQLSDSADMIGVMDALLLERLPLQDPYVTLLNDLIDHIHRHRELTAVKQLSEYAQMSIRTLQRLFNQYVGVHPKWVIQLYRLQNAAELLDYGYASPIPELAAELGYFDQSHFIRDFKAIIGITPEEYIRRRS